MIGAFSATPDSAAFSAATRWASRNTGDSDTDSRTNMPTMISTADSRNGIRQPQLWKAASDWKTASKARTPVASRLSAGAPACGHEAQKPRFSGLPCSDTSRTAPPHSPPRAKPWMSRRVTSRIGARTPTVPKVGSRPIANVDPPIISSEMTSSFLRPIRSPKWPKTRAPIGRAAKPTA